MTPTLDRRARLLEFLVVLALTWVPVVSAIALHLPNLQSLTGEVYGLIWEVGTISLVLFVVWRNGESFRRLALRRTRWWAEVLWAFLVYCADWLVVIGILVVMHMFSPDGAPASPPIEIPSGIYGMLLPLFLLISAATEELLFRGYLWDRIHRWTRSGWLTLLLTALMFTAVHPYEPRDLIPIFSSGVVWGLFRLWGRSLPRLILAHFAYNLAILYHWR